jgi:hypothetical protein
MQQQSEVVRLMQQIQAEYKAGQRIGKLPQDLRDYFVNRRVENMEHCQQELIALVGQERAGKLLAEVDL